MRCLRLKQINRRRKMKIYVACLKSYNNGILHGKWVDATKEVDEIDSEITTMLKELSFRAAEEWAIHDYDGFGDLRLGEYPSLTSIHKIALFLQEHEELGEKLLNYTGCDIDHAQNLIDDNYLGKYEGIGDYAREMTKSCTEIPHSIEYYIDYDSMGKDMLLDDLFTLETDYNEVHVFQNI